MNKSDSIKELAGALAKAQSEIATAAKDSMNPHFRSRYADLASVWEACRGPLTANGLSVVQSPRSDERSVTVETLLMHQSGEWLSGELSAQVGSIAPQAVGSAVTYLRRYALAAIAGVAPDDDDGEAAQGRGPEQQQTQSQPGKTRAPRGTYSAKVEKPKGPAPEADQPFGGDGPTYVPLEQPPIGNQAPSEAVSEYSKIRAICAAAATMAQVNRYRERVKTHPELSEEEKLGLLGVCDKREEKITGKAPEAAPV